MKNEHPRRRARLSPDAARWSDEPCDPLFEAIDDGDTATSIIDLLESGGGAPPVPAAPESPLFVMATPEPPEAPPVALDDNSLDHLIGVIPAAVAGVADESVEADDDIDPVIVEIQRRRALLKAGVRLPPRHAVIVSPGPWFEPPRPWWKLRWWTGWTFARASILASMSLVAVSFVWWTTFRMPGESPTEFREMTSVDEALQRVLTRRVKHLAEAIGPRNVDHPHNYVTATRYIDLTMSNIGWAVDRQPFLVTDPERGLVDFLCENIVIEIEGEDLADEIVVLGVHYDTTGESPGANDNATGVAAAMCIAEKWKRRKPRRTTRFVFFANGAESWRESAHMGSRVYARRCRANGDNIVAMIAVDGFGCYRTSPESQWYPPYFDVLYPDTGDFVAFIGNQESRVLMRSSIFAFRKHGGYPAEGIAGWDWMPFLDEGDHRPFWEQGYEAFLMTDTGPYRNLHHGSEHDTPGAIDFERLARATDALERLMLVLSNR